MPNKLLKSFGKTVNDSAVNLPKSRSNCFDIGTCGGCGLECEALHDGECEVIEEVIENNGGKKAKEYLKDNDILEKYEEVE